MSHPHYIMMSMNVYRGLLIIFILTACSSEVIDELDTIDTIEDTSDTSEDMHDMSEEQIVFTPTTSTSTTTTTLVSELSIEPRVQIICDPIEDEGYLGFEFIIYNGTSELVVLNIVSWLDSSRADDLFIYDDLPAPNETKELIYWVDPTFSQYEMEMLVMDKDDNFITDYCLWNK